MRNKHALSGSCVEAAVLLNSSSNDYVRTSRGHSVLSLSRAAHVYGLNVYGLLLPLSLPVVDYRSDAASATAACSVRHSFTIEEPAGWYTFYTRNIINESN